MDMPLGGGGAIPAVQARGEDFRRLSHKTTMGT